MKYLNTEVLIIGSGFGAAAPAMHLSKAGYDVTIIEKGPDINPYEDLKQTQDPKYLGKYLKSVAVDNVNFGYAEGLGGGSTFYEMVSLRAPSLVFDQKDGKGERVWPSLINRNTLDPFYDRAEKMLNVHQIAKEDVPKSGVAFSHLMKNLGYTCDRARYAVKNCIGSGYCITGCVFGAKQSLHSNYLPIAKSEGIKILTGLEAISIDSINENLTRRHPERSISVLPYRYTVLCSDIQDKSAVEIKAKVVVLAGGTVGTAKILLKSETGLPRLSKQTGKNIALNGSVKILGLLPESFPDVDMFAGMSHPGMISYHFFEEKGITISSAKPSPIVLTSSAQISRHRGDQSTHKWGKDHVELMKMYRKRMIVLYALGLTKEGAELSISPEGELTPILNVNEELKSYYENTKKLLNSILIRNGAEVINTEFIGRDGLPFKDIHFGTSHMVGSCKMADNKELGVTNFNGEVFDYPGLFVTDGAAIPGSLAVNPSLTILANAERISDHLLAYYSH